MYCTVRRRFRARAALVGATRMAAICYLCLSEDSRESVMFSMAKTERGEKDSVITL